MSNFLEEQLKSATLEETPSFKVSGRHTEPSDHDYYILEHPINSEYTKQVFRFHNLDQQEPEPTKENTLDSESDLVQFFILSEVLSTIKSFHHSKSSNAKLQESLARIAENFDDLFLDGKPPLSVDANSNKKNKKSKGQKFQLNSTLITRLQIVKRDKLLPHLNGIENFVNHLVDSKKSNHVTRETNRLVVMNGNKELQTLELCSQEELLYLVTLLLLHSDMGKKPEVKSKYSWIHKNVNDVLLHEIRIALRSVSYPIAKVYLGFFTRFSSEDDEATNLIQTYTLGLFAPIIKQNIRNKSLVEMAPYQEDFAKKISDLIEQQAQCILGESEWPSQPRALFNLNTFGTGKTTIGAISTSHGLAKANEALASSPEPRRLVGVFTLPSLQTSVMFASVVAMKQPTWVIRDGKIIPLFNYCPKYKIRKGNRVFEKIDRWAEFQSDSKLKSKNAVGSDFYRKGLDLDASLIEQVGQLLSWCPEKADNGREYLYNFDEFKKPVMLFADSESALELNRNAENFKQKFGWHFLNVLDEFPATADCNFRIEENQLLQNVMQIIGSQNSFNILMSASPTREQIQVSHIFKDWDCIFAEQKVTTRSFTQLFTEDGRSVHPLQGLDASTFDSVRSWNDTDFRFFTPNVFLEIRKHLRTLGFDFSLSIQDVECQDSLIEAIKKLCHYIADLNDSVKESICKLQINVEVPCSTMESSLTLTTGNLEQEILSSMSEQYTHEKIEQLFEEAKQKIQVEIQDVQNELALSEMNREKSMLGSKESLTQKIDEMNRFLEEVEKHQINLSTNLGTNTISFAWYEKYKDQLSDDQLAAVVCGLEVEFENEIMTKAIKESNPKPRKVVDTITSMYGRNDHRTKHVIIKDPNHMIGFDTLKQALARAGRDGMTPVVTGILDHHLLALFQPNSNTSIPRMDAIQLGMTAEATNGV